MIGLTKYIYIGESDYDINLMKNPFTSNSSLLLTFLMFLLTTVYVVITNKPRIRL